MEPTEATQEVTPIEHSADHPYGEFIMSEFDRLMEHEPNPIKSFESDNAEEQKQAFLNGSIDHPDNHYPLQDALNTVVDRVVIKEAISNITSAPEIDKKFVPAYQKFGDEMVKKLDFLEAAKQFKSAEDDEQKQAAAERFMQLNIELYGAPNEDTYYQMLAHQIRKIDVNGLDGAAKKAYDQLLTMIPADEIAQAADMYRPQQETMQWMHTVVEDLFKNLLAHVPEADVKNEYSAQDVRDLFEEIIRDEFSTEDDDGNAVNAAEGWKVELAKDGAAIRVDAAKKIVFVPERLKPMNRKTIRGRVVHELGDHFLRSVTGGETDLPILGRGMVGYYDFEEGFGRVLEQALDEEYKPAGLNYYLVAGAMYFGKKNFKDTFDMMWRLDALATGKDFNNEEALNKSRSFSYNNVNRLTRGTDELPWFKDLSYSKDAEVWKYLDSIRGDDFALTALFAMGRFNPTVQEDVRTVLETATRQ